MFLLPVVYISHCTSGQRFWEFVLNSDHLQLSDGLHVGFLPTVNQKSKFDHTVTPLIITHKYGQTFSSDL